MKRYSHGNCQTKIRPAARRYEARSDIASEGSFYRHPTALFVPGEDEMLLLRDYDNNLEIAVIEIPTKTNFCDKRVGMYRQVESLLEQSDFQTIGYS